MKKLGITITLLNRIDEALVERKILTKNEIRSIQLNNVVIDTATEFLYLPQDTIKALGLTYLKTIFVRQKNELVPVEMYQDAKFEINDRHLLVMCIGLPNGQTPRIGYAILEKLGIAVDFEHSDMVFLPQVELLKPRTQHKELIFSTL